MKKTLNYNYNMPDREDKVKVADLNQNAENIDIDLAKLNAMIRTKAPIDSPQFSGIPKAPKPGEDKVIYEQIATTGYVGDALEVEVL